MPSTVRLATLVILMILCGIMLSYIVPMIKEEVFDGVGKVPLKVTLGNGAIAFVFVLLHVVLLWRLGKLIDEWIRTVRSKNFDSGKVEDGTEDKETN